jgi:hypothetical protein
MRRDRCNVSLAVFLEPLSATTGWSRAGISSGMTLNFKIMGLGAFGWGAASERFGTRIVVLIGAALLGLALVLASQAASLVQFQLTYGILVGLARPDLAASLRPARARVAKSSRYARLRVSDDG